MEINISFHILSSSGKVVGYRLDAQVSEGVEIFLYSFMSRLVLESTQPSIKCVLGAFPGVKAAEHRTSHHTSS